jgi:hypothetical protein
MISGAFCNVFPVEVRRRSIRHRLAVAAFNAKFASVQPLDKHGRPLSSLEALHVQ